MSTAVRMPAVAGRFYPADAAELRAEIKTYTSPAITTQGEPRIRAVGCVVPHAGYMYSGHVAGAVYRRLELPRKYIILCPNHTGMGDPLAIMSHGLWRTPLGEVAIDQDLCAKLKGQMPLLSEDAVAHRFEHALEVQLPFLQVLAPDFTFAPITIGTGQFEALSALGIVIGRVAAQLRRTSTGDRFQRHESL